jgi:uncharacterized membrane protein YphA (DoxX/SURF4 family)
VAASGTVVWVGRVISWVLCLLFLFSGIMKLVAPPEVAQGMAQLGLPAHMLIPLALLEIGCAVVYLIPATSVTGAILLVGYMGGAMLTHWRVGEWFVLHVVIALLVWLGIYLREPRLKALIPFRKA